METQSLCLIRLGCHKTHTWSSVSESVLMYVTLQAEACQVVEKSFKKYIEYVSGKNVGMASWYTH